MKITYTSFIKLLCIICMICSVQAHAEIRLKFDRNGTTAKDVKVILTDEKGKAIGNATASLRSSHPLVGTKGEITNQIICPNANGNAKPNVTLTFHIKGLATAHTFKYIGMDIHALNGSGGYQNNDDSNIRQFNINTKVGQSGSEPADFGTLKDIDIAAGVISESGNVNKIWAIENEKNFTAEGDYQIAINITAGSINKGCFIGFSEIILTDKKSSISGPVALPFAPSPAVGNASVCYSLTEPSGKALTMGDDNRLSWTAYGHKENQNWYFVEENESFLMVNLQGNRVYNLPNETETLWTVVEANKGEGFYFIPTSTQNDLNTRLTIDGISNLFFNNVHNAFARASQIYAIPCGTLAQNYITRFQVKGDVVKTMQYPLSTVTDNHQVSVPEAAKPASEYLIYTGDKATAAIGKQFEVSMELNEAPLEGVEGFLYFDWDKDGIFEASTPMQLAKSSSVKITVPQNAKIGSTRARIRITENGMKDGDSEVIGQIFDWILNIVTTSNKLNQLTVSVNNENRGTVTPASDEGNDKEVEVKATPLGNSVFVCWREGNHVLSLEPNYKFTLNHDTHLVAYFSPNTERENTAIEKHFAEKNKTIDITTQDKYIKIKTSARIIKVMVFTTSGKLIAHANSDTISLKGVPVGSYIVKVYTDISDETSKILLK